MDLALLLFVCLILKIVVTQLENKQRREEERQRRIEEEEADRQEEVSVRRPNRKIPFEIPTMRQSEPNAETKLPQADRIFIRPKKTAEPGEEQHSKREPRREVRREMRRETRREAVQESTVVQAKSSVNPLYLERLAMKPTARTETEPVMPTEEVREPQAAPRIPTSRDRLIEGIILAEVLGKPKAYQNRERMR